MTNFLQETREAITDSGHTPEQIRFIGSEDSGHQCSWDEFCTLADFKYDSGCGKVEIAPDLIFVFQDGQRLWRGEYDGSEWWEYSTVFIMPEKALPIFRLHGQWPKNLAMLNKNLRRAKGAA